MILPGGFSYGDYLRSGAIARFSPVMQAVQRHAADGGPVLGICNGFQILCEAHLLPGALMRNAGLHLRLQAGGRDRRADRHRRSPPPTRPVTRLRLPVAHGDGRFVASDDTLRMLEAEGRVVLRYVADTEGSPLAAQSERVGERTSPASATPPATSSASCPTPSAPPSPLLGLRRRARILHFHGGVAAAGLPPSNVTKPMSTEKPSRNEDEYFAQQNAELLRKQREKLAEAAARRPSGRRTT